MHQPNDSIQEFLDGCHYATLATFNQDNSIHLTPVWYLFDEESFMISSGANARKVKNVMSQSKASIVVDSRRKQGDERWVGASGTTEIISGEKSKEIHSKILNRYITEEGLNDPGVGPGLKAAGELIIRLIPTSWTSWELKSMDDKYFGGLLRNTPDKWFLPVD